MPQTAGLNKPQLLNAAKRSVCSCTLLIYVGLSVYILEWLLLAVVNVYNAVPPPALDNMYSTDILSFRLLSFYFSKTAWRICWARGVWLLSLWLCTMRLDGTVHAASNGKSLLRNLSRSAQRNWPGTVPPARCPGDLYTSLAHPRPQFWSVHLLRKRQCSTISGGSFWLPSGAAADQKSTKGKTARAALAEADPLS